MPTKVYLIGTVHTDTQGPERLEKLLNIYKPDVIFCENAPGGDFSLEFLEKMSIDYLTEFVKENYPKYSRHARTVARVFKVLGYEFMVPKKYAAQHGAKVIKKDSFAGCKSWVDDLKKEINSETGFEGLVRNYAKPLARYVAATNRIYYADNAADFKGIPEGALGRREKIWAKGIRKQNGTVAAVLGCGHVFRKPSCLYELLADLDVERIRLCEADKLGQKPCGHPDCSVSTGIDGSLAFGRGELDSNGYFEHPCYPCARAYEKSNPKAGKCWPFSLPRPWLKRDFEDKTVYEMGVAYVIEHLNEDGKKMLYGDGYDKDFKKWRAGKMKQIIELLDSGLDPLAFDPINAQLYLHKEEFQIIDGFSRLAVFHNEEIKTIKVKLSQNKDC